MSGEKLNLIGLSISSAVPGATVDLELRPGFTALYGKNGSGKSRILSAVARLLGKPVPYVPIVSDTPPKIWNTTDRAYFTHVPVELPLDYLIEELAFRFDDLYGDMGGVRIDDVPFLVDLAERLHEHGSLIKCEGPKTGRWVLGLSRELIPDALLDVIAELRAASSEGAHVSAIFYFPDGFDSVPEWAAIPILDISEDWPMATGDPRDHELIHHAHDWCKTLDRLLPRAVVARDGLQPDALLLEAFRDMYWDESSPHLPRLDAEELQGTLGWLSKEASVRARRYLGDAAPLLKANVRDRDAWHHGDIFWWTADTGNGSFPIVGLSSAQTRWCSIAIEEAIADFSPAVAEGRVGVWGEPETILLIDEPEQALHPTATERVALALGDGTRNVLAATHSPVMLGVADHIVHVRRPSGSAGGAIGGLGDLHSPVLELQSLNPEAGLMRHDFLAITRVLVLVEGVHDRTVFRILLNDALLEARAQLSVADGSRRMADALQDLLAFTALDCPILCVLDDFTDADREWWQELDEARRSDPHRAEELVQRVRSRASHRGDRWDTFRQLADLSLQRNAFHRIHLDGIPVLDVPQLLPPSLFGLNRMTWAEINEAVRSRDGRLTSEGFKRWMHDQGSPITPRTLIRLYAAERG